MRGHLAAKDRRVLLGTGGHSNVMRRGLVAATATATIASGGARVLRNHCGRAAQSGTRRRGLADINARAVRRMSSGQQAWRNERVYGSSAGTCRASAVAARCSQWTTFRFWLSGSHNAQRH